MNSETNSDTQAEQRTLSAISFQPSVETIDDGYALCDKQSLKLVYCNQIFRKWFDVHELHITIGLIIDTLKTDILLKRLAKRGSYTLAIEPEHKQRGLPELMDVSFKPINKDDTQYIALHVRNMTKLLEKEALIQSHSRVIEQSNQQLARLTKQLEAENSRLSAEVEVTMLQKQYVEDQAEISRHKAISQMVAGVAHEINTPISIAFQGATFISDALTLDTITELAKNEDAKEELIDVYKASKLIKISIIQADKLISSFKNLSVRQVTDTPEQADIKELIDELLALYPTQQQDSKLTIEVDNSLEEDTKWFGYPGKLTQVLLNLINNAQIHAYKEDPGTVKIILTSTNNSFIIKIQDFGSGISKESIDQVFTAFYTTRRGQGGSGLGMAIVHDLVTSQLQGTIDLSSQLGDGTTVTIEFPKLLKV